MYNESMSNYGTLYLVGTPVGNKEDISLRTLKYLKNAKNIVVERRETFDKILKDYNIENTSANIVPIWVKPEWNIDEEIDQIKTIIGLLKSGEDVYVFSDEGMPIIPDQANRLVKQCRLNNIKITATPGPTSIIPAVAMYGSSNFVFLGFPIHDHKIQEATLLRHEKSGCPTFFMLCNCRTNENQPNPDTLYFLQNIEKLWGDRQCCLYYNLTTSEEKTIEGKISDIAQYYVKNFKQDDELILAVESFYPYE